MSEKYPIPELFTKREYLHALETTRDFLSGNQDLPDWASYEVIHIVGSFLQLGQMSEGDRIKKVKHLISYFEI